MRTRECRDCDSFECVRADYLVLTTSGQAATAAISPRLGSRALTISGDLCVLARALQRIRAAMCDKWARARASAQLREDVNRRANLQTTPPS